MRISKKAEYALRALVAIARQSTRSWSIQELASGENIPIKFLEQILLALRHAGMLNSKRGVGGGYTLVRQPGEIRVSEVIELLDGAMAPVPCAAEKPSEKCTCPDPRNCALRILLTDVRRQLDKSLGGKTIEDMVESTPGSNTLAFDI